MNQTLTNARLVLPDEVVHGTVYLRDGLISDISSGRCMAPEAVDLEGDLLIPGLIELHTDNLERHLMPRPRTPFPAFPALLAHDAEIVSAGITTVFDAIGVGDPYGGGFRDSRQDELVSLVESLDHKGVLRAKHLWHVRCELPSPNAVELFQPFIDSQRLRMISLMDHTPGQRQWTDVEQARTYFTGKKGWSDAQFEREMSIAPQRQKEWAQPNREYFASFARDNDIVLATHDDTTEAQVDEAVREGARISEFPTTEVAAKRARSKGLANIAGAPNVVRGGSHSGNVAAVSLARQGLLDILSSDYVPRSLTTAAWLLREQADYSLPQAIDTVSRRPAKACGLSDRGAIQSGLRADLVRIKEFDSQPIVRHVWVSGSRVH